MTTQVSLPTSHIQGPVDAELILMSEADKTATFSSSDKTAVGPGDYWCYVRFDSFDNDSHDATLAIQTMADSAAGFSTALVYTGAFHTITVATAATTDFTARIGVTIPAGKAYFRITATMSSGDNEALGSAACWLVPIR